MDLPSPDEVPVITTSFLSPNLPFEPLLMVGIWIPTTQPIAAKNVRRKTEPMTISGAPREIALLTLVAWMDGGPEGGSGIVDSVGSVGCSVGSTY